MQRCVRPRLIIRVEIVIGIEGHVLSLPRASEYYLLSALFEPPWKSDEKEGLQWIAGIAFLWLW